MPGLVEDLCDAVNESDRQPIELAALVLWKLNWIHPFVDGNGRTSRAVSYLALCVRFGQKLAGRPMIPELLTQDRRSYYAALADAADAWDLGVTDVSQLTSLLRECLKKQLRNLR